MGSSGKRSLGRQERHRIWPRVALVLVLLTTAALGVGVDCAAAARPVKGALYADSGELGVPLLYLKVSRSGRWLNPQRSAIDWDRDCGELRLHLGSRRHPVRIKRSGGFRFVRRRGNFVFRLRGRFVTSTRARVTFRYRREPARPGRRRPCDDDTARLRPRRITRFHLGDCRSHKAETLLLAPTGRVFRELRWIGGWTPVAYACLYSTNRAVRLGEDVDDGDPGSTVDLSGFRLVGRYVAYIANGGAEFAPSSVGVHDLQNGKKKSYPTGGRAGGLVLKGDGSVAWIVGPFVGPPEVWAADALGVRRLDSGNVSLLALNGSTVTWVKDGVVHSATLY
jgi:hypothetical protein